MKYFYIILSVLFLNACSDPSYSNSTKFTAIPEELKECKFFTLLSSMNDEITVIKCPNSSTSATNHGKYSKRVIVIDGSDE